jgi:hypothetical protein
MNFLDEVWPLAALVGGILLLVFLCRSCSADPNAELVAATRAAVELANHAQENNDAAYLWPGRFRLLAVAIGVGVPSLVAAALFWLLLRGPRERGKSHVSQKDSEADDSKKK